MVDDKADIALRLFTESWQKAIDAKDWHSATLAGISAYLYFTVETNDQFRGGALGLIVAAFQLQQPSGTEANKLKCSFCGKDESEVRLGAGPSAYICENCVRMFAEIFSQGQVGSRPTE